MFRHSISDEPLSDEPELRETCERFYAASDAVLHGDEGPMLTVWSHSDESSYCDPRGEIVVGDEPSQHQYDHKRTSYLAAELARYKLLNVVKETLPPSGFHHLSP